MAAQYEMCKPYEIVAEPTGIANETAYRLRILKLSQSSFGLPPETPSTTCAPAWTPSPTS